MAAKTMTVKELKDKLDLMGKDSFPVYVSDGYTKVYDDMGIAGIRLIKDIGNYKNGSKIYLIIDGEQ